MDSTNILRLTDDAEDPVLALRNVLKSVAPTARRAFAHALLTSPLSRLLNPRVRVTENAEAFLMKTDVPGIPIDRIRVTLDQNGLLRIELPEEKRTPRRRPGLSKPGLRRTSIERVRIVALGPAIVRERAAAAVEDGVLTVLVPKRKPVTVELETSDVRAA